MPVFTLKTIRVIRFNSSNNPKNYSFSAFLALFRNILKTAPLPIY